jgi:hypothetical protein
MTDDLPIPDCRNALVEGVMGVEGLTHVLMVDDDVILPKGGLKAMLDMDADCVIIDYPTHWMGKGEGTGTATYDNWKIGEDFVGKEIIWAGLGCCLVKAEVFNRLEKPYFRKGGQLFDRDKNGKVHLYGLAGGDGGEDFEFFQDLRKIGIKVTQVPGMVAGHAKVMKQVGVITPGKYVTRHEIIVADKINRPLK